MNAKLVNLTIGAIIGAGMVIAFNLITKPEKIILDELPEPYYKVLLENDNLRIVEHKLEPGETEPTHNHPPMYVYFLKNAEVIVTSPDGISEKENVVEGFTLNVPALTHSIENQGSSTLHSILVEFKN